MKKTLLCIVTALLLLGSMLFGGYALEEPDMDRTGSISVTMLFEGEPVPGGSLTAYRVADIKEENGADYSFILTEAYADAQVDLTDLNDAAIAPALQTYIQENSLPGTKQDIAEDGSVVFSQLPLGLYLLVQETPAQGYLPVTPFLVSVPTYQEGSYLYEVDGSPKLALEKDPTPPPPPPPPDIPQTGLNQLPIPFMAAGGAILVILGWILCATGRKKHYEA